MSLLTLFPIPLTDSSDLWLSWSNTNGDYFSDFPLEASIIYGDSNVSELEELNSPYARILTVRLTCADSDSVVTSHT